MTCNRAECWEYSTWLDRNTWATALAPSDSDETYRRWMRQRCTDHVPASSIPACIGEERYDIAQVMMRVSAYVGG